jgi:general nucleoside transport system ATP-binding protein
VNAHASPPSRRERARRARTIGMTKIFGPLVALDDVSIKVKAGSFHALLGENGAGKSTLVKCIMGFYTPTRAGAARRQEVAIRTPARRARLGIGMVYQHFTLVPCLTAAENLVISRADAPAVIDWKKEKPRLEAFMDACRSACRSTSRCRRCRPARSRSSRS